MSRKKVTFIVDKFMFSSFRNYAWFVNFHFPVNCSFIKCVLWGFRWVHYKYWAMGLFGSLTRLGNRNLIEPFYKIPHNM